ncbi:MAG: hypothetical protein WCZ27_00885 [Tissierellaceae bacterium]
MGSALTIQDLFKLVLFLLGIGALTYLIIVFKNINKLLTTINTTFEANVKNINSMANQLPEISQNINAITKTTNTALKDLSPEVTELIHNVNDISTQVGSITDSIDSSTHKIVDTLDIVTDSVSETAFAFQHNVKSIDNYIKLLLEVIETIKNYIKKR